VSDPDDAHEREAERIAERVTRASALAVAEAPVTTPAAPALQTRCVECEREDELQRAANGAAPEAVPPVVHEVLAAPGRPLDVATRAFFEPRFGADFSLVRVHDGTTAVAAAEAVRARAFTVGNDIVFNAGEFATHTDSGRHLLAHELTHVMQQGSGGPLVQRAPDNIGAGSAQPTQEVNATPPPGGFATDFEGVTLSENPAQVRTVLEGWVAQKGLRGADEFLTRLEQFCGTDLEAARRFQKDYEADPSSVSGGVPLQSEEFDRREKLRDKVLPVVRQTAATLDENNRRFLADFEAKAREAAQKALDVNELEVKKEAVRYGITEKQVTEWVAAYDGMGGTAVPVPATDYGMESDSAAGKGLQAAAKVLLGRRQAIDRLRAEQNSHLHLQQMPGDPDRVPVLLPDEQYDALGQQVKKKLDEYDTLRASLSAEYPVLAAFSERDKGTQELEKLAAKGPGKEMAVLIGKQVAEKLSNIGKVHRGLDKGEVNVWRLPKLVGLTQALVGADTDPMKRKLVAEKVDNEQPGIIQEVAVLVLNIAALALAGPTGGASLAVALVVNATVAVEHTQQYLVQEALAGTAFDKAKALSSDDPSLFWLAVEIIGVFADAVSAAEMISAYRSVAKAVKAAEAARAGSEAAETLEAAKAAARQAGKGRGGELAERVAAEITAARKGEDVTLKAAGATEKELSTLGEAAKATEAEAEAAGPGLRVASGGEVKVTRGGHLFSCASPCQLLREKYAEVLAREQVLARELGQEPKLSNRLAALEKEAAGAATGEARSAVEKRLVDLELELRKATGPADTFKVGRYKDLPAEGEERHHAVLSQWMKKNVPGYDLKEAPVVRLPKEKHNATRGVLNRWRAEMRRRMGGEFDWAKVTEKEIIDLSEAMFDAAGVPLSVRQAYYSQFRQYFTKLP
jgi:hypothetical protein